MDVDRFRFRPSALHSIIAVSKTSLIWVNNEQQLKTSLNYTWETWRKVCSAEVQVSCVLQGKKLHFQRGMCPHPISSVAMKTS